MNGLARMTAAARPGPDRVRNCSSRKAQHDCDRRHASSSSVVVPIVQRQPQEPEKPAPADPGKLAEAGLETEIGKGLVNELEKVLLADTESKAMAATIAGVAVGALAANHEKLPGRIPIPLGKGLSLKVGVDGPLDSPTGFSFTFDYKPQAAKSTATSAEAYRAETARMAAEQAKFLPRQAEPGVSMPAGGFDIGAIIARARDGAATKGGLQLTVPVLSLRRERRRLLGDELKLDLPFFTGVGQPRLQPKLAIGSQNDPQEHEADLVAEDVVAGRSSVRGTLAGLTRRHAAAASPDVMGEAPVSIEHVLANPGRPLDLAARAEMEQSFGCDFSQVRVHDSGSAAQSARDINAQAYTAGNHLVFDTGRFAPATNAGRRLLAHELTHVVQQTNPLQISPAIQRKPNAESARKWYQEAIDQVALADQRIAEQAKQGGFALQPFGYETKKALLDLCEAVDRGAKEAVPKKLDTLLKAGLWVHLQILSRSLLTELSARIYELGLEADAERLRKAYAAQDRPGLFNDDTYAARRKVDFYTRLVGGAISSAKYDSPASLTASIHQFVRTFVALRDEYVAIDWKALEWEMHGSRHAPLRPYMSHEEFYRAILGQIERWQVGLSTLIQQAMDGARQDLESRAPTGSGAALLTALRAAMVSDLREALFPKDAKQNISDRVSFDVTKTTIGKGGSGSIGDVFPADKLTRKRRVPVTTYDPEQGYVRELRASIERFYQLRIRQLDMLGRIYGALGALEPESSFADTIKKAEEAKDNEQSIRAMPGGRLRLDSDGDWRAFLLQRYNDLVRPPALAPAAQQGGATATAAPRKAATPVEALHTIIALLFDYLRAFTVHARFTNLYDIGETSYLNRPFPRALTGQLVHDCGVYALRVAYMLSLVRKELGLRFRFVTLPAHVSLVITGDKLPTFVVENDRFDEWSPEQWEAARKEWEGFKEKDSGKAPSESSDEEQFVGEVAAAGYIQGPADMPFRVTDVPAPVADSKAEQKRLWAYYQGAATKELFGPSAKRKGDPNYLFHKRYLALTEEGRQIVNETVLPFWNEAAPSAWGAFQKALEGKRQPSGDIKVDDLLTPLAEYKFDFGQALEPVKARLQRFDDEQRRLSQRLRADPKLKRAGVRYSAGLRAATLWHFHWDTHAKRIERYENDLVGRPADASEPLNAIEDQLKPFFMPPDKNRLEPLD